MLGVNLNDPLDVGSYKPKADIEAELIQTSINVTAGTVLKQDFELDAEPLTARLVELFRGQASLAARTRLVTKQAAVHD
jgi:hypothetical protein